VADAIRVVIADDSMLIRRGLTQVLRLTGFELVGEAGDADALLQLVAETAPDVAIVDVRMPPTHTNDGIRAARAIRARHPGVGVLVLSQFAEPDDVIELLADGADGIGYLLKERVGEIDDIAAAIRRVAAGGSALDPAVVEVLISRAARKSAASGAAPPPAPASPGDMEQLMLDHAIAWAREHACGVARPVGEHYVAVLPDGRHASHAHFFEALEWLDAHGAPAAS
jgi:DNA-binding NarL/FixJ family response regulator